MVNENYTTIESRVASAILERHVASIDIDGHRYEIAPPTLATLIMVSEIVSTFPVVDQSAIAPEQRFYSALHNAQYYQRIGEMVGVLILGAKNITGTRVVDVKRRGIFRWFGRKKRITQTYNRAIELGDAVMNNIRPSLIYELIVKLLQQNEITTFFAITTSLSAANLIKPTKEVVND
nr:MAG TPA: hypothetical protein [Caudoviricetes sp.]